MSDMLILTFSLVLFAYWWRYHCLMVLKTKPSRERARQVARANNLEFLEVRDRLQMEPAAEGLQAISDSLFRDYRTLTCLLRYTSVPEAGGYTTDQRMLMMDFRLMQLCYLLTRRFAPMQARRALEETSEILNQFAGALGARTVMSRA